MCHPSWARARAEAQRLSDLSGTAGGGEPGAGRSPRSPGSLPTTPARTGLLTGGDAGRVADPDGFARTPAAAPASTS